MSASATVRRCCGAVVLALSVIAGAPSATAAAPAAPTAGQIAERVRQLDRDVSRVSAELARGAAAYEAAQDRLARLTSAQFGARDSAEARTAEAAASQASFDELARSAYKGGVPPLVTALLSGDPGAVADLAYVRRSVDSLAAARREQALLDQDRQESAQRAFVQSDADRRSALVLRQAVDLQLEQLLRTADRLSAELAVTADQLVLAREAERSRARARAARQQAQAAEAARAAQAAQAAQAPLTSRPVPGVPVAPVPSGTAAGPLTPASSGARCQPPSAHGEANGFLSDEGLCPLSVGRGHRLRTDAARAFDRLNAAHLASVGTPLCVTDSYRSYAAQVDVFKRKPSLAATPGTSQHGWGLAVDLCGGVQTFGTAAHAWMRAHAPQYGWTHPRWAQQGGRRPEPWHWEYVGA